MSKEYSERYHYNLIKIVPPGADPHDAAESFRQNGMIDYDLLPMTSTLAEYATPRPMPTSIVAKGIAHPYEMRHQYLWQKPISKEERVRLVKEHLRYSPLGVSVTAWKEQNGVYVDNGQPNTHWTMLYGWTDKGWKIYDSYSPNRKILSFDHNIEVCKRYVLFISTRKAQLNIFASLLQILQGWLNLIVKEQSPTPVVITPPVPIPAQPTPPKPSLLIPWAKSIELFENSNKNWQNPGAIRGTDGKFLTFPTYQKGFDYLVDYLRRAATGKHQSYKPDFTLLRFFQTYAPITDKNNPEQYCKFVADRLGIATTAKIKDLV